MQRNNIRSRKTTIFLVIILLLLCIWYTIKVIGRIDRIDIESNNEIEEFPVLGKPDEIFIGTPANKNRANGIGSIENGSNVISDTNVNSDVNGIEDDTIAVLNTNENNINNGDTSKDNDVMSTEEEGFWITDKAQIWETESMLRTFENPLYNMQERIAPGSSNSYAFNLINNNNFTVKCDVVFIENNPYGINMQYRLKQNGSYICGDSTTWVPYEELQSTNITLNPNESIPYVLEWKWFNSANDTQIGKTGNVQYSLSIKIYAEEI